MSGTDAADSNATRRTQVYGAIIVVGGGCYGGYYVRQLQRAARAQAITAREIIVVDRDSECAVARTLAAGDGQPIPTRVVVAEWSAFFEDYLERAAANADAATGDAIVPSPLMPHLMGDWLVARARARWPDRDVRVAPFDRLPAVPWERAGDAGTHYVSFATWMCPINCIEPRICPHTRDERSWSIPDVLRVHAAAETDAGRLLVVAAMHCRHRAYGVGMFDTSEVLDADRAIAAGAANRELDVIVGTASHCHGALTRLVIGASSSVVRSHVG